MRVKDTTSIPLILVGNKCDMSSKREVEKAEGEAMAKTLGCEFLETSAKTCINVEQGTGQRTARASAPTDGPAGELTCGPGRRAGLGGVRATLAFYSVVRQIRRKRLSQQKKTGAKTATKRGCTLL